VKLTTGPRSAIDPAFSADGSTIVFSGTTEAGPRELFTMPASGGPPTQLTTLPDVFKATPAFSPDGTRIVFTGQLAGSNSDIWVVNADGTGAQPLITGPEAENDPSFSPSGQRIVFATRPDGGGRQDIFDANADGTGVRNLTARYESERNPSFLDFQDPSYSPDGKRIAVATNFDNRGKYVIDPAVMRANGAGLRPVVRSRGYEIQPVFSPDGKRIAFARFGDAESLVLTVKLNGRGLKPVAEITNHIASGSPAWQPRP
jgi:TolB protein